MAFTTRDIKDLTAAPEASDRERIECGAAHVDAARQSLLRAANSFDAPGMGHLHQVAMDLLDRTDSLQIDLTEWR